MGYYISTDLGYYEGDRISPLDQEYSQRPSASHIPDGNRGWAIDKEKWNADIDAKIVALEGGYPLARLDREMKILDLVERAAAQGVTREQLLDPQDADHYSPGFAKLVAFDAQIAALRRSRK